MKLSVVSMKRVLATGCLACQLLIPAAGIAQQARTKSALDEAKKLVQGGNPTGALTALERADLHGPNVSDVHAMRGICLALLEKPIESAAEFDQAISLRPEYAPNYFSAGLAFASFNNLDRALDRLAFALKLDPSLPGLRYNFALVLARAGRFAESEKQVDLELRKHSASLDLWQLKARDDYYQKKWEETITSYHHVLALSPDRPEAYGEMGEALFSLNRSAESTAALQKAVALDPDNGTAHNLLGKLFQDAGKQQDATREFETAHRLVPSDREVIYRLYRIYLSKGDQTNSARLLKDLQEQIASNKAASDSEAKASVLNGTGIALEKKGDLRGALDAFNQAAQADVANVIFQRNAALLLCKLSRPDEAIRRLRDILTIDPDDAETLRILAAAKELANGGRTSGKTLPQLQSSH
jgi:tetratricopeptide (TPR) repeat protein